MVLLLCSMLMGQRPGQTKDAPRKPQTTIPKMFQGDVGPWHNENGSPLAFAKLGDHCLSSLRGAEGRTVLLLFYDGEGQSQGELEIRSPHIFRMDYATLHYPRGHKDQPIDKVIVRTNGQLIDFVGGLNPHTQAYEPRYRFVDARSVQDYAFNFPKYLLGSIHGEGALARLVSLAQRSPEYRIVFSRRSVVRAGKKGEQIRTVIVRKDAAANRLGPFSLELIADATTGVPVQVELKMKQPGHLPFSYAWFSSWRKNNDFSDADFKVSPYHEPKKATS